MPSDQSLADFREQFPIFREKVYVNSCSQGALSSAVEHSFHGYLDIWHEKGSPWDVWVRKYEELRTAFAGLIGAEPDEVAICSSASMAVNSFASALDFRERDKIVTSEYEFPTMGQIWLAQRKRGGQVQFLRARDGEIPIDEYERSIGASTRIVPLTHVCYKNGYRADVRTIAAVAHERGALVLLDDFQDCGTRPINVRELGVDFYVTGTLKYLLGPSGLAFFYAKRELIEQLEPTCTGWFAQRNPFAFDAEHLDYSPTARRFENGTPPIPSVYPGLAAIDQLARVGLDKVERQVTSLAEGFAARARAGGFEVVTPGTVRGPLVVLRAVAVDRLVEALAQRNVVASSRDGNLRVSFHAYNNQADVDTVIDALDQHRELLADASVAGTAGR